MTFVMGLLVALARRILREELQIRQNMLADEVNAKHDLIGELQHSRRSGAVLANENEKLNTRVLEANHRIAELIEENQRLSNDLSASMVAQNQAYESKRASETREEDQRAINRELELRLRKIRELLG